VNVDMTGPRLNAAMADDSVRKVVAMAHRSGDVHSNKQQNLQYFGHREKEEIQRARLWGQPHFHGSVGRPA